MWKLAVFVVALVACKKSGEPERNEAPGSTAPAPALKRLDVATLLTGTKGPRLIGPYAKARFGMTQREVMALVPDAVDFHDRKPSRRDPDGAFYIWFDQTPANRGFEILTVYLPEAQIGEVERAWGKPTAHLEGVYGESYDTWLDREARVRAVLGRSASNEPTLEIMRYQPLEAILGPTGSQLAIETKRPLIGATFDELAAAYPEHVRQAGSQVDLDFQVDEFTRSNLFAVTLRVADAKTTGFAYSIAHGNDAKLKDEQLARLVAKYGPATRAPSERSPVIVLGKHTPEIVAIDKDGTWTVESPRRP